MLHFEPSLDALSLRSDVITSSLTHTLTLALTLSLSISLSLSLTITPHWQITYLDQDMLILRAMAPTPSGGTPTQITPGTDGAEITPGTEGGKITPGTEGGKAGGEARASVLSKIG